MAMKDYQTISVPPSEEEETVKLWMSFGWEVKNTERIKTQDVQRFVGQDSDGTKHYQTTYGTDFVKLTFERDPERKNYAELKVLEEQYYAPLPGFRATAPSKPSKPDKPKKPGVVSLILMIISALFGAFLLLGGIFGGGAGWFVAGVIFFLPGIFGILRRRSFSSRLKSWEATSESWEAENESWKVANEAYQTQHAAEEKALSEAKKKRADALEKARSLV
jgi:hypothetical protein